MKEFMFLGASKENNEKKQVNPFMHNVEKMVKHTLRILQCAHRNICKVCLTIFDICIKGLKTATVKNYFFAKS